MIRDWLTIRTVRFAWGPPGQRRSMPARGVLFAAAALACLAPVAPASGGAAPASATTTPTAAAKATATAPTGSSASHDAKAPPAPDPADPKTPETEGARKAVWPRSVQEMEKIAKADPIEFLRMSLKWTDENVTEYSGQFQKIENIDGTLRKPETMQIKFRADTFSVYLKWIQEPSKGQEAIYVEGTNDGKAWVHPSGLLGVLFRKVSIDPLSKTALKHSRRPVTMAGMANMLRIIIPQCEAAQASGDLKLTYEGLRDEGGRQAYVFKRVLPKKGDYPCNVCLIYIDQQYLVCVRTDAFDWSGELISHYSYFDLLINPGLTDTDFDPANGDYGFRLW